MNRCVVSALMITLVAGVGARSALGQDGFPSQPIEIVSPYPPGGPTDRTAQALASAAQKHLGQRLVVVFKPGGGGAIGATYAAKAKADGYTLFLPSPGDTTVKPNQTKVSYSYRDFVPIARVSRSPYVLAVRADSPWKTIEEFVADAKKRQLSVATLAPGSLVRIAMEMFHRAAGIRLTQVPHTGFGPTTAALLGSHVDAAETVVPSIAPQVEAGKARVLAITGPARVKELPNVPTFKEARYDIPFSVWIGVSAPAGTPPERVAFLRQAFAKIINDPDFLAAAGKLDVTPAYASGEELGQWIEQEDALVKKLLKESAGS
ncbi:MAG: tripartite tricarboxylate transporter substrate binding protein [Candidatus Rokubacteria bacterium]|nr:tripartite tricarboxylate transporter substrate binding protein [Candidatus Rokubacteria bacterium]MBI3109097.1 tripartite tricarboxylate transporter substrate binding protein [Candidatus Rokubacteria bacterium]